MEGARALHTPSHLLLHTQVAVCVAAIKVEGYIPPARALHLPQGGSLLLQVIHQMTWAGWLLTITGTIS